MQKFTGNIEELTLENNYFRKVINTASNSQLVLMSLKPGEDIGVEVHTEDQFFRFESGEGKVIFNGDEEYAVSDGVAVVVPSGMQHNIVNTSATEDLKLYTIYSPAHHPDGTIHETKEEAEEAEKMEG
jgi:mannose-6-phosphate isomerase-like protein (cupin superfamily)